VGKRSPTALAMKVPTRYYSVTLLVLLPVFAFVGQNSSCNRSSANNKSTMNANSTPHDRDLRGLWGGEHISMEVTDDGAQIQFDCAHGRIEEKLVADRDDKFELKGVYAPEHGGPVRMNENNEQPAVYRGSIKEKQMTLTIELAKDHETVGTFTLTHGSGGRIRRCL
jgi:hypothetical protein